MIFTHAHSLFMMLIDFHLFMYSCFIDFHTKVYYFHAAHWFSWVSNDIDLCTFISMDFHCFVCDFHFLCIYFPQTCFSIWGSFLSSMYSIASSRFSDVAARRPASPDQSCSNVMKTNGFVILGSKT